MEDLMQISIFDALLNSVNVEENSINIVSSVVVNDSKPKTKEFISDDVPPKDIVDMLEKCKSVFDIEQHFGTLFRKKIATNSVESTISYVLDSNQTDPQFVRISIRNSGWRTYKDEKWNNCLKDIYSDTEYVFNLLHIDKTGTPWTSRVKVGREASCLRILKKGKWEKATRLLRYTNNQSLEEIDRILQDTKPYTHKYMKEVNGDPLTFIIAPELEMLHKAGYKFAENYYRVLDKFDDSEQEYLDKYNRLLNKTGKVGKLKHIFKTSQEVCKVLKEDKNMDTWDRYRKMDKFGRIKKDDILQLYEMKITDKELDYIQKILSKQFNGKNIFNLTSLTNYINRVDMYEAIPMREALILIKDYLEMCHQIGKEPKIDGDSLKREHDVTARTHRIYQAEKRKAQNKEEKNSTKEKYQYLRKYDYSEEVFFIRGIRDMDDLLDEANQQSNCVASYHNKIINQTSLIFVLREKSNPKKSIATIELSPDGQTIRQKYLAYNRPIHNKSMTDFIERWHVNTREVMRGLKDPFVLPSELDYQDQDEEVIEKQKVEILDIPERDNEYEL